jgi:hypothetical protein
MQYLLEVNGAKRSVYVDGETPLLWVLRDTLDLKGTQVRLRSGPMRCLHGAYGRPPDPLLPDPHRFGRHVPHYHAIEAISESKIGQNVQAAWIERCLLAELASPPTRRRTRSGTEAPIWSRVSAIAAHVTHRAAGHSRKNRSMPTAWTSWLAPISTAGMPQASARTSPPG